jgi:hypothetical protein
MIDQTPGQPYVISTFQQHIVPLFPLGRLKAKCINVGMMILGGLDPV